MGDTTTHGLPYPEGTDRVMDGDNAIQALAESVDTLLAEIPRAMIEAGSIQAIANSSNVRVNFTGGAVKYDNDGMADLANDRLVIRTAGMYRFNLRSSWQVDPDGFRATLLYVNSVIRGDLYLPAVDTTATIVTFSTEPIQCSVGDVIEMHVVHTAGSTRNLYLSNGRYSHIAAEWVTW